MTLSSLQELCSCMPPTSHWCDATFSFLRSQYLKVSMGIAPEISTSLEIALLKQSISLCQLDGVATPLSQLLVILQYFLLENVFSF